MSLEHSELDDSALLLIKNNKLKDLKFSEDLVDFLVFLFQLKVIESLEFGI